jgi:hypothetical protein
MEMIFSFLIGFVSVWFITKSSLTLSMKPNYCPIKDSIVNIAKTYGTNDKIARELTNFSMNKIKEGNHEYIEVIDTIKRRNHDKARA